MLVEKRVSDFPVIVEVLCWAPGRVHCCVKGAFRSEAGAGAVHPSPSPTPAQVGCYKTDRLPGRVFFTELLKGIDLGSLVDNDVDLKIDDFNQNVLLMSPPASDSGSQAGFSPYSIDSEPGSPLLDDAKVMSF